MSSFSWLDYSERERTKMLGIIDQFNDRETRDEMGIGSVRDAFADLLFPGTSTIMTRAKYFLMVPWTYQRLEGARVSSAQIAEHARRAEINLIKVIEDSDDNDSNIGKVATTTLKRLPSSIYWQGLGTWGIRCFQGSQAQYHRCLDSFYLQMDRRFGRLRERDAEQDDQSTPTWHAALIPPPSDFPKHCTLRLKREEAEYLADRIRLGPATHDSMLAELVALGRPDGDVDFAWDHPSKFALSERTKQILAHARKFSEMILGSALLYNLMLAEKAKLDVLIRKYHVEMANWSSAVKINKSRFIDWERDDFWKHVCSRNARISSHTQLYVNGWWDLVLSKDPRDLEKDPAARSLIRSREQFLKKRLSRLDNADALGQWQGNSGTAQLDYRWRISRRLLQDIFEGLGGKIARAGQ